MVRIISPFLLVLFSFGSSVGKSVDENTAKLTGANFYKTQGVAAIPSEFSLVYKATSVINGAEVTDFYVFNRVNGGFVIVSGDDKVKPVLGWSAESLFTSAEMPGHIAGWLNNYKDQINYAIKNNLPATTVTSQKWAELQQNNIPVTAGRTTSGNVPAMVRTFWNQSTFVNDLCPYDNPAAAYTLTGCVATAMAQVMKYWSWPRNGEGMHSYSSSYGTLSSDFSSHTYQWDSMPNSILKKNMYAPVIMYDAGVSVNMHYGVTASGAYVLSAYSPVTNCTEYALKNYFSYKPSIHGEFRSSYDDSSWVLMLKAEIDAKRPVIYTGYGSDGGHCFIADGYLANGLIHINWGWGFTCDGFYAVEDLTPGGSDFNDGQAVLAGIEPDSSVVAGVKQLTADNGFRLYPNPATDLVSIDLQGTTAASIHIIDITGRVLKVISVADNTGIVTVPVNDLAEGLYFAELHTAAGVLVRKLVIAK